MHAGSESMSMDDCVECVWLCAVLVGNPVLPLAPLYPCSQAMQPGREGLVARLVLNCLHTLRTQSIASTYGIPLKLIHRHLLALFAMHIWPTVVAQAL